MIFLLGEEAIPKRIGYTGSWPKTGAIHANTTITAVYTKDCDIIIPPQPTSPGEIMSGGEGEPVEADVPAEDETIAPQGMHVTGTQTVTHEYLTLNGKVARETIKTNNSLTAVLDFVYDESGKPFALKYSTDGTSFATYYYVLNDNEAGLYYLRSRYYDLENHRFINADTKVSTGQGFVGTNLQEPVL